MPDTLLPATTSPATTQSPALPSVQVGANDMLANPALFEHMQRVSKVFCASALIPDHLKKNNGADAFLALQIARERNENPVTVMQNIYFVSGKAGWSASYMIARANKSGAFKGRINWRIEGKADGLKVTAFATLADTGEVVEADTSMAMAVAEGWTKNPKYKTMPDHMLKYRSATMLVRLYCPEVLIGMQTSDELEDLRAAGQLRDITGEGEVTTASTVASILAGSDPTPTEAQPDAGKAIEGEVLAPGEPEKAAANPWFPEVVGQDAITAAIVALINDKATSIADLDAIDAANKERVAKFTQANRAKITNAMDDRREDLGGK